MFKPPGLQFLINYAMRIVIVTSKIRFYSFYSLPSSKGYVMHTN
jgi:hypothetical protein